MEEGWIRVFAPGTSANLGPGFDTLGLALEGISRPLGDTVSARRVPTRGIRILSVGGTGESIPLDPAKNAVAISAQAVIDAHTPGDQGLELKIEKGLPVSSGLGGSAASACAGALAAAEAFGLKLSLPEMLTASLAGEAAVAGHHLDNIAPCLMGGVTLVRDTDSRDVIRLPAPACLRIVVAVPPEKLDTRRAREVLKKEVPLATAVAQWANVGALVSALYENDLERMGRAMIDQVASPYRLPLMKYGQVLQDAALAAGAFGSSISGAGPTIFAITDEKGAPRVVEALEKVKMVGDYPTFVALCRLDTRGARRLDGEGESK